MPAVDPYRAITRELLVRYLDGCAPPLLHAARRLTYAAAGDDPDATPAALAVFAEFPELLVRRRLQVVVAGTGPQRGAAVTAARERLGLACDLHISAEPPLAALRAAGSFGAPILAYLDLTAAPGAGPAGDLGELLSALAANPGSDVLMIGSGTAPDAARAGFAYSVAVELAAGGDGYRLLLFASNAERHLDAVKDALWAVDEYGGVRYRDPTDPEHTSLDISLAPQLGPLRRALLAALGTAGAAGYRVGELREYTRAHTIYRAAEAPRAIQALLHAGLVHRDPLTGRLTADTLITLAA